MLSCPDLNAPIAGGLIGFNPRIEKDNPVKVKEYKNNWKLEYYNR
jgi:hypothetical protein